MIRRLVRRCLLGPGPSPAEMAAQVAELNYRVSMLENRLMNRRKCAIDETADYLVGAQVPGDYVEFGVYIGTTFSYACILMAQLFPEMRFIACDSFEGLPTPRGLDAANGYTSNFRPGEFACAEDRFMANLKAAGVNMDRVKIIKGWFDKSLTAETARQHKIEKIAAAWIDCDLYESTVPVLDFIAPRLSVGSVVLFDDWRCFRNLPDYGEQRACREWLERNPRLRLKELFSFGWHGQAFTVSAC